MDYETFDDINSKIDGTQAVYKTAYVAHTSLIESLLEKPVNVDDAYVIFMESGGYAMSRIMGGELGTTEFIKYMSRSGGLYELVIDNDGIGLYIGLGGGFRGTESAKNKLKELLLNEAANEGHADFVEDLFK